MYAQGFIAGSIGYLGWLPFCCSMGWVYLTLDAQKCTC